MKSLYTAAAALEDFVSGEAAVTDAVWMTRFTVIDSAHSRRMMRTPSVAASADVLYCQPKWKPNDPISIDWWTLKSLNSETAVVHSPMLFPKLISEIPCDSVCDQEPDHELGSLKSLNRINRI